MPAQKKREREREKERNKDSPYFPKGIHSKERDSWFKQYQKYLGLGKLSHPFKDQMECILLCVPRDQSHIS
jgi:hypothetical protein